MDQIVKEILFRITVVRYDVIICNTVPFGIYLGLVPNLCGHNPV